MPYIKQQDREDIASLSVKPRLRNAGELNYYITELLLDYIKHNGKCYQTMNDIMGALDGCKLEFYRRLVAPYEDDKIEENGDVY